MNILYIDIEKETLLRAIFLSWVEKAKQKAP